MTIEGLMKALFEATGRVGFGMVFHAVIGQNAGMAILNETLPLLPWMDPRTARLPGVLPLTEAWLEQDDAFAGQMAERDRLIAERPAAVHALTDGATLAALELFDLVLATLATRPGYTVDSGRLTRPDGIGVDLDRMAPLLTLGRLVQEDLCLLERQGDEHVLTGAMLCFPASWTLAEKIGRPLMAIHRTVAPYDADMGRRVQRMFDLIRHGQPLWRMNSLLYADPTLHAPRLEGDRRPRLGERHYVRCEKQCFVRLPVSQAVVFSIHTYVVQADKLPAQALATLIAGGH